MLFMMVQTTKVELQPVQQSIVTTQSVESIDNVWYTRRSINQKTQVRNVYLDSIVFYGSIDNIPSTESDYLDTPTSIYKVWKLNRNEVNSDFTLKVPVSWTYLLLWKVRPEFVWTWFTIIEVVKNWVWILVFYIINSVVTNMDTSFNNTVVLEKWDTIQFRANNESDDLLDITLDISLTKIS
jgi:hypothetical protein